MARRADQIELVDLPPERLRRRMLHGEIHHRAPGDPRAHHGRPDRWPGGRHADPPRRPGYRPHPRQRAAGAARRTERRSRPRGSGLPRGPQCPCGVAGRQLPPDRRRPHPRRPC
ncbi:hypothetical protein [Streptomyces sp. NBC_01207]|uniref:hypothetical protein n=1 Tax=Streptomyces sp. NBC_01207 TaxID=2903772 RepID=UPI002E15014D|nr:hypothetical protein OG457_05615 [Streptomyces sp. NBC_01207]